MERVDRVDHLVMAKRGMKVNDRIQKAFGMKMD